MQRSLARSKQASANLELLSTLQQTYADRLSQLPSAHGHTQELSPVEWLRDGGAHGGGIRWCTNSGPVYDRASVNISQVHYDDVADKRLGSATALSCIVHPANPFAPSSHMHVSWTEMKSGTGYWRVMADLNPSIPNGAQRDRFSKALAVAAPAQFEAASAQGDRYFWIPALDRHRGVSHFYLEQYGTESPQADRQLALGVAGAFVDIYTTLVRESILEHPVWDAEAADAQLAYHTLYLFQVLTLDRGTTSGILVHDQNDVGIMGSLPSHVDRDLLASWRPQLPEIQRPLLDGLLEALPDVRPTPVEADTKRQLAATVRAFYRTHPDALEHQARGDRLPPTVRNHT